MCNDKMNKDEILKAAANISNSLYNLRKDGELDKFDENSYVVLRQLVRDFYDGFSWEILLSNERGND